MLSKQSRLRHQTGINFFALDTSCARMPCQRRSNVLSIACWVGMLGLIQAQVPRAIPAEITTDLDGVIHFTTHSTEPDVRVNNISLTALVGITTKARLDQLEAAVASQNATSSARLDMLDLTQASTTLIANATQQHLANLEAAVTSQNVTSIAATRATQARLDQLEAMLLAQAATVSKLKAELRRDVNQSLASSNSAVSELVTLQSRVNTIAASLTANSSDTDKLSYAVNQIKAGFNTIEASLRQTRTQLNLTHVATEPVRQ